MHLASELVFLSDVIKSSQDAIISKGTDSIILTWNPAAEKMFGYTPEEAIGKNISLIIPKELHFEEKRIISVILRGQEVRHYETRRVRKDGRIVHVSISISPIRDYAGNIIGASKIARDITEKKIMEENLRRSEAIYKTIASSIPSSIICVIDLDYRYILIEGDMLDKLGYSKEGLLGNKVQDVISPDRVVHFLPKFEKALGGEIFMTEEQRGEFYTVDRYVPIKSEEGKIYGFMIAVMDITEQKKKELQIRELNIDLEKRVVLRTSLLENANKELEAFCYSISHDLRTPLRALNSFSQILIEEHGEALNNEGKRILKIVVTNAKRMGHMIDDLLNFSRLGKQEVRKYSVDMNELVEDVLSELRNIGIQIPVGLKVNELRPALADYILFKSVWTNLISNAIKYSKRTQFPEITIGMQNVNGELAYYIKDNGTGFNMEYVNELFRVFHRLHREDEFEGIGVGLAIVKRIVERHGGQVWAEGKVNEGATFYFTLGSEG